MSEFRHFLPITVRYSDIDAQGHVNNTRFVTYIESARFAYLKDLELWDGEDFMNLGVIVADNHVSYIQQIKLGQEIQVATRVAHIGNKSMKFEFEIQDTSTREILATAETVNVCFDYNSKQTFPVPAAWRETINSFEGTNF